MPIYEYNCAKCGVFEVTQRITESPLRKCPTCKGKVERIVSRTSFILKGSGWYATDYAKSGAGPKHDSSTSSEASSSAAPVSAANGAAASSGASGSSGESGSAAKPAEKSASTKTAD